MFTFKGTWGFIKNDCSVKLLQYFFVVLSISATCLFQRCSSSDEKPADTGLKYFPLSVGNYWVYDVSEITFDTLIQDITIDYQERFDVVDSFKNQLNEITYVIHLSKRNTPDDAWENIQTWTAKVSNANEIIVTEENIAYVKLILPVREGSSWLGNKYNTIEADRNNSRIDNYIFQEVNKPFGDYANTITVQQSNDINLVYKDVRASIYAEKIGLVYQINNYIDYCDDDTCLGLYLRKHERTKIQTLAEYVVK
jgi:hypothetical protein